VNRRAEVIVVALIVCVVCALVFPFFEKVRDGNPMHAQCQYNLLQIGRALHGHHDTFGFFPPGTLPQKSLPSQDRLSWHAELLPFVEQMSLYQRLDTTRAWNAPINVGAVNTPVKTYLCPCNGGVAGTDYVGMAGVGHDAAELAANDPRAGFFGYDRTIKAADVTDGLSTTLAVLETMDRSNSWAAGGVATVRCVPPGGAPSLGPYRPFGGIHRPEAATVISSRPYGGLAVFADGSVRFLTQSISPRIFEALATIAGGEEVGPDF
jgi:hypothetical protein